MIRSHALVSSCVHGRRALYAGGMGESADRFCPTRRTLGANTRVEKRGLRLTRTPASNCRA